MLGVFHRNARQHDRELVTTEAPEHILRAQTEFQSVAERLEQRVTGLVTEAVVDCLELIKVEIQHGADFVSTNAVSRFLFEATPVEYTGQWVAQRVGAFEDALGSARDVGQAELGEEAQLVRVAWVACQRSLAKGLVCLLCRRRLVLRYEDLDAGQVDDEWRPSLTLPTVSLVLRQPAP